MYKIETPSSNYYIKISKSLIAEKHNLKKLENIVNAPRVIAFYNTGEHEYLLISELPGKNLVELLGEWPVLKIVDRFAEAVRQLHGVDVTRIFPQAGPGDVLLHGDMALPNIIVSNHDPIGYIDFGQMAFGTPELDIADAIWSLQRNFGPSHGERFLKKYGPVTITPKIEEALTFRYQPS